MPPALRDYAEFHGVTNEHLVSACTALANFINVSRSQNYNKDGIAHAWVDSGLAAISQPALVTLFSSVGMACANAYFVHLREALPTQAPTPGGDQMSMLLEQTGYVLRAPDPAAARRRLRDLKQKDGDYREETRCDKGTD